MRRRAAYFALRADYFGRPFDDGILRALLAADFDVDYYSPDGELPQSLYPRVTRRSVEYRRRWLQQQLGRGVWKQYALFLGTADLPMAFAGSLAKLAGRPVVTVCDEIYIGGYEGHATGYWKTITRWMMRGAAFTILTDLVRVPLQREYASLPKKHEFIQYPCSYADVYDGRSREVARRLLGIRDDEFVLSFAGTFLASNGAGWVVRLLDRTDARVLLQTGGRPDPVTDALLTRLDSERRLIYLPDRLGWRESLELTVAADASLVIYLSQKPEFQHMGVSSQKLCTALWLGMPVIATQQESFRFIDEYGCGLLVEEEGQLAPAVERVRQDHHAFAAGAPRAVDYYIRAPERLRALTERFRRI